MTFTIDGGIEWEVDTTFEEITIRPASSPEEGYVSGQMKDYEHKGAPWYSMRSLFKRVLISNGVLNIGNCAFDRHDAITSVSFPNTLTKIGDDAFYVCDNERFTVLHLPDSVTHIGISAFAYCTGLSYLRISKGLVSIGSTAFSMCNDLGKTMIDLEFPNGLKEIGDEAFKDCYGFDTIVIPESVESIGRAAFYQISDTIGSHWALSEIYFKGKQPQLGADAFKVRVQPSKLTVNVHSDGWANTTTFPEYSNVGWNFIQDVSRFYFKTFGLGIVTINGEIKDTCVFSDFTKWTFKPTLVDPNATTVFHKKDGSETDLVVNVTPIDSGMFVSECDGFLKDGSEKKLISGETYELNDFLDGANGGLSYIIKSPGPGPLPPGPILSTYPIAFYNSSGEVIYKNLGNTSETFDWGGAYRYDGGVFKPSLNAWQMYQSSYIIPKGTTGNRQLKKIINNYYLVDDAAPVSDQMRIYIECGEYGNLDLGEIQSIKDTYTSDLAAIPVVPYGFSRGFCMDLGVKRQIVVNYKRVMPENYDDVNSTDSRDWSNAKWIARLKKMMDRWQMRTNGIRLYQIIPEDRKDCYPEINPFKDKTNPDLNHVNAFIINAPIQYSSKSTHEIESSITFQIGTIYPKATPLPMSNITLKNYDGTKSVVVQFPSSSWSALPYYPSEISAVPEHSYINGWQKEDGTFMGKQGTLFHVPEDDSLVLQIALVKGHVYDYRESDYRVNLIGGEAYHITMVGGGGGGGGDATFLSYTTTVGCRGGGGGGGYGLVFDIQNAPEGSYLILHVGKGGDSGKNGGQHEAGTKGENGGMTWIEHHRQDGSLINRYEAKGGDGGGGADVDHPGSGGSGYGGGGGSGGKHKEPGADGAGHTDTTGRGGLPNGDSDTVGGGGGGGAAQNVGETEYGCGRVGSGGNGVKLRDGAKPTRKGQYGGGGGNGYLYDDQPSGGHGYICIMGLIR